MYILYSIFSFLLWPVIVIGLIVFFVRRGRKKSHPSQDKEWYLQFALSKEDAVSQLFLLLSLLFFGVTLLAFNRDFGNLLEWRTILFITSAIGLVGAYYLKTIYSLIFSLIGLTSWWGAQAVQWIEGKDIKTSALFVGLTFLALLFYSLGHLHEKQIKFKRFALVYLILGIISVTGALFFFSTKPGIGVIGEMTKGASFLGSWQLTLSLFIFLVSLVGVTLYSAVQKLLSLFELLAVFVLACLFGITAFLPEQAMFVQSTQYYSFFSGGNELSSAGILWAVIYNFAIFFELLGLILSGYIRRETWPINIGALFLFLLIIVKYFDWFFTFLDKSIFFIGAGILLFVVGWFMERGRRYMISNIKVQTQQVQQ
ncbi:MAG: hypothetical protein Q8Q06_00310 [bacterium]|nr:hypothetical protein [bacterium]